jgi:hypothetical protein
MLEIKQYLKIREKIDIIILMEELKDFYGDFYLTKNNLRLYIKENLESLFKTIKKGDKVIIGKEGLAIITGYADHNPRKYVKLLTKDLIVAEKLLKFINWNFEIELYAKLKRNNPLLNSFYKNGFNFCGGRGKEVLIMRKKMENKNANFRCDYEIKNSNTR